MDLVERSGLAHTAASCARRELLDWHGSSLVDTGYPEVEELPDVASCSSAAELTTAVGDAAGAVEVASTDQAAVGAWACSARMVSAASAVELAVLERVLAVLMTPVYHVQECGIQLAAEEQVADPAGRAHCTAVAAAAALSGLEALSRRRHAGLLGSRTR